MANTVIPSSMQKEEGNTDKSDEHTSGGSLQDFSDADALDKAEDSSPEQLSPDDETEYISGFKLGAVTAAVSLCSFLMLLDMSIVSTVCLRYARNTGTDLTSVFIGDSSHHQRLPFSEGHWLVCELISTHTVSAQIQRGYTRIVN